MASIGHVGLCLRHGTGCKMDEQRFIKFLPDKSVKKIEQDDLQMWNIQDVSDEEQKDIEDELKNPDCHIVAFSKTIT